jgi:hypothetical protein
MVNARGLARLGMLGVGLGIGAAVGSAPGVALADDLDIQISIDGFDLLPTANNSATATSGMGDFAVAVGNGANATATVGFGDFAEADGTDALATAGGASGSNFDSAIDMANNTIPNGAFAVVGSDDIADVFGDNGAARAGGLLSNTALTGNNDIAYFLNPFGTGGAALATSSVTTSANFDFVANLFDNNVIAASIGESDMVNILSPLGDTVFPAATAGGNLLTDLLSLF